MSATTPTTVSHASGVSPLNNLRRWPMLACEPLIHDDRRNSRNSIEVLELAAELHCRAEGSEIVGSDCHRRDRRAALGVNGRPITGKLVREATWRTACRRQAD